MSIFSFFTYNLLYLYFNLQRAGFHQTTRMQPNQVWGETGMHPVDLCCLVSWKVQLIQFHSLRNPEVGWMCSDEINTAVVGEILYHTNTMNSSICGTRFSFRINNVILYHILKPTFFCMTVTNMYCRILWGGSHETFCLIFTGCEQWGATQCFNWFADP